MWDACLPCAAATRGDIWALKIGAALTTAPLFQCTGFPSPCPLPAVLASLFSFVASIFTALLQAQLLNPLFLSDTTAPLSPLSFLSFLKLMKTLGHSYWFSISTRNPSIRLEFEQKFEHCCVFTNRQDQPEPQLGVSSELQWV